MLVVELGIKLDKNINYYKSILEKNGLKCVYHLTTRDIYFTNKQLDNLSEREMKDSCIRLRKTKTKIFNNWHNRFQNYNIYDKKEKDEFDVKRRDVNKYIKELESNGFKKVFDTKKEDYQFCKDGMKSRVQLQLIKDIGLLIYYDNPDYYGLSLKEQRKKLIDELNSYGIYIKYNTLGLDKLRTLYYGKEMYSENQNG